MDQSFPSSTPSATRWKPYLSSESEQGYWGPFLSPSSPDLYASNGSSSLPSWSKGSQRSRPTKRLRYLLQLFVRAVFLVCAIVLSLLNLSAEFTVKRAFEAKGLSPQEQVNRIIQGGKIYPFDRNLRLAHIVFIRARYGR